MTALDRIFEAAAEARGQNIRQSADRPRQRRCAEQPGSSPAARIRSPRMELRESAAGDGLLHFTGYASVYDTGYEMWDFFGPYTEQVTAGAGAQSLATPDLDVPLVLAHDSLRRIARTTNGTLSLVEDGTGLLCDAPQLDAADQDVAYIGPKLRAGLIDEMSFKFMITSGEWSPDWMEYHITGYDIHRGDVAIVGYGANPFTAGAGLRGRLDDMSERELVDLENRLCAARQRRGPVVPPPPPPARPSMTFAELDASSRRILLEPPV